MLKSLLRNSNNEDVTVTLFKFAMSRKAHEYGGQVTCCKTYKLYEQANIKMDKEGTGDQGKQNDIYLNFLTISSKSIDKFPDVTNRGTRDLAGA